MDRPNERFRIMASARMAGEGKGEVMIYSAISPYSWDEDDPTVTSVKFDEELKKLEGVSEITVRVNSPGGSVDEATAIRTMLEKHPAKKVIDIEGLCASAATIIACMPGARVRMAKGGSYMIHRASWMAWGHADDMLAAYNSLKVTDDTLAGYYSEKTGMSKEECLDLMTKETWYSGEGAMEAGFVDEIIKPAQNDEPIAACAVSAKAMRLMRECYAHTPEGLNEEPEEERVSNEETAVAAAISTENKDEGGDPMELKEATAEMLVAENPELVEAIRAEAVNAERQRIARIEKLTPKGARFAQMAKDAKANGTSVEDYLEQVIEAQDAEGQEYLEARARETQAANEVGGGDSTDNDKQDVTAMTEKAAKEIAEMCKDMTGTSLEMA